MKLLGFVKLCRISFYKVLISQIRDTIVFENYII